MSKLYSHAEKKGDKNQSTATENTFTDKNVFSNCEDCLSKLALNNCSATMCFCNVCLLMSMCVLKICSQKNEKK